MEAGNNVLYVDFPNFSSSLLESLNQQRMEGKFCDISIHVQGKVFKAHRAVLAASSPYFHDQVLFRNTSRLVLPGVMDSRAFESILASCYAGRLAVLPADIVSYLTVGSFLQMWHVVDKCTELLRDSQPPPAPTPSCQRPCRTADSQSPSSSNYFSPREVGEARPELEEVAVKADEAPEDEEEDEEEVEDEEEGRGGQGQGAGSRRSPATREGRGPGPGPHPRWVFVKKEKPEEDLVLTCEEDEHHFVKTAGCRRAEPQSLSITDVCTLAGPELLGAAAEEPPFEEPSDLCGSSEEFAYEGAEESGYPPPGAGAALGLCRLQDEARHGAAQTGAGAGGAAGGKMFACHCGKAFTHKSQRDRHINMHLNLRPFGCTICSKKFKMKHHLVEHMKIHTGHKPFECHICGKKFMWRDSFLRHRSACEKLQRATNRNSTEAGMSGDSQELELELEMERRLKPTSGLRPLPLWMWPGLTTKSACLSSSQPCCLRHAQSLAACLLAPVTLRRCGQAKPIGRGLILPAEASPVYCNGTGPIGGTSSYRTLQAGHRDGNIDPRTVPSAGPEAAERSRAPGRRPPTEAERRAGGRRAEPSAGPEAADRSRAPGRRPPTEAERRAGGRRAEPSAGPEAADRSRAPGRGPPSGAERRAGGRRQKPSAGPEAAERSRAPGRRPPTGAERRAGGRRAEPSAGPEAADGSRAPGRRPPTGAERRAGGRRAEPSAGPEAADGSRAPGRRPPTGAERRAAIRLDEEGGGTTARPEPPLEPGQHRSGRYLPHGDRLWKYPPPPLLLTFSGRRGEVQRGLCWKPMEPGMFQVEFPNFGNNLLRKLNQQRMEGKLCDITIHLQGQMFKAHRAVLAASSPYFHDQVLLKNASRIVLPGVMSPKAFENVLASSYTGKLTILSPEIVSYLTVASFLQMWHVVDKCTELLQESQSPPAPSHQAVSQNQSPSSSNYLSPWHGPEAGANVPAKFERPEEDDIKLEGHQEEEEEEEVEEEEEEDEEGQKASPGRETEQDNVISNSAERDKFGGEGGAGDGADCPYPVPGAVPHKRWVLVKAGKSEEGSEEERPFHPAAGKRRKQEGAGAGGASEHEAAHFAEHSLAEEYDEFAEDPGYDETVDYYGSSDDFHFERMVGVGGGSPNGAVLQASEIQENGAYGVLGEPGPSACQPPAASDFPGGVYKLYPCQCGKSFAHKSQRDRHMSMHLNVRPFGCPICSKKFKMKHHLMGHMKIHTGHKPYECHYCGKKFMWRDSFTRHRNACAKLYHAAAPLPDLDLPSDLSGAADL
ncbi:zinc finger and BTB domain-containing protein 4-like [Pristis pectinata]|uniref:zinc finger and BTB domain-containing protein 4-like n=1 Tax=Pristis pectinata TaxID=685728 RepID=UPI00223CA3F9|nr:zinc finger and BTB domain-containing protein 4-like [Pristis pectinata]